ncbi:MAG: metallophosphoesterase, partial [bacterium]
MSRAIISAQYAALRKITFFKGICLVFLLMPAYIRAEDSQSFNFAVMGCAHLGVCDEKDYELAVRKIKERKPDFVVFLGGMVDGSRSTNHEALWQKFDSITAKLGVPVYNVPGNCTLTPLVVSSSTIPLMEKFHVDRYKKRYHSFEHKKNLFIFLDSESLGQSERDENGIIEEEQLEFIATALENAWKYDGVFVFQHRTSWDEEDVSGWFQRVHPLMAKKVKYVFSAGRHFFDVRKADGVTYVTSGSPSCLLKPADNPVLFHFLSVYVNEKRG